MDVEEPNPGRLAKRQELRRQRRSVFMTMLIGATVTAVLAAAAAFRIKDTNAGGNVKIVTTTTSVPPVNTTADTIPDTTLTTLFVPESVAQGSSPTTDPKPKATTTTGATTTTSTSTTTTVAPPPPANGGSAKIVWGLTPAGITLPSGGLTTITLTATNEGNGNGVVTVPPCPAPPRAYSVNRATGASALSNTCHPGQQTLGIAPGQRYTWTETISATNNATRTGSPLSAGNYLVNVNKAPSPVMFVRMTVN